MKGLTGHEAAKRLERRGGQFSVFRYGQGSTYAYDCRERQAGAAVVMGHAWAREPTDRSFRIVLDTDEARAELARAMEAVRDRANAGLPVDASERFVLTHREQLDTDAGYAQIGCALALLSTVVGLIVGTVAAWLLTDRVEGGVLIIGPIIGFVGGLLVEAPLSALAVRVPPLRDRIELLSVAWSSIVPGVVTAIAIVALTALGGGGNGANDF
jgi:uncharacterized membrane protein YeaQ/YmgE (transglycosylase-associated protein family)